jgi:nuclear transport factor 2 (NTF2) superfamily protein
VDHRLIEELRAFTGAVFAVRSACGWHDDSGHGYRSRGNATWELNAQGFMTRRLASINDLPIGAEQLLFFWPLGRRPDEHPGLSDLGL